MIEEILEPENLSAAWKRVKRNKGAPGIDGMTVEDFPAFAREHWPRIATAIREGTCRPAPVKRAWIPKPDGTKRPLGIPTVLDRVIQQAIAQVLGPLYEAVFSEHSHGYRPGRSAQQAIGEMESGWKEGRRHVVECDLKSLVVMVKSANAAKRVMASLIRFCEEQLLLVVNRAKSRAAPLKSCEFLSFRLNHKAELAWTVKAQRRFKERIREWERSGHRVPGGEPREG